MPNVKGIILNGGPNRVVDGVTIDASEAIYDSGLPILKVDHQEGPKWSPDLAKRREQIRMFIFDICQAEADWNVDNFIKEQVAAIREQVGDKQVLLALSGGVDSSVVAALLIKPSAIDDLCSCHPRLIAQGNRSRLSGIWQNVLLNYVNNGSLLR